MEGSRWFRRFVKELKKISPHIRIKKIRFGFYRIYFKQAYLYEVYKEMPQKGYDIEEDDLRFESQKYYQEYEDNAELTRKIKNFVEGYWDAMDILKTRIWMMKHNEEYYQNAVKAYRQMVVK